MNNQKLTLILLSITALLIIILTKGKTIMEAGIQKLWTWDKYSNSRIKNLHPEIQNDVRNFINEAERQGIKLRITIDGHYRSIADQAELYAKGRTAPGKVVTNAKPGQSYHNYKLAVDVVEIKDGKAIFSANSPNWPVIGSIGKSFGFEWGGDWQKPDRPHFQKTGGKSWQQLLALHNAWQYDADNNVLLA